MGRESTTSRANLSSFLCYIHNPTHTYIGRDQCSKEGVVKM